jgi:ribulose-5-phosphate 4-epimerase/fuculose-1-phosphate aldolase
MFAEHGVPDIDNHSLIVDSAAAEAMAERLGQARALLLRGHGVLVVGEDARWAVRAAVALERAVKLQSIARTLGELTPIDEQTAREFFPRKYTARAFVDRPGHEDRQDKTSLDEFWAYWTRNVRKTDGYVPHQV